MRSLPRRVCRRSSARWIVSAMLDAMRLDKKVLATRLRFVLLEKLGRAYVTSDVATDRVRDVLNGVA